MIPCKGVPTPDSHGRLAASLRMELVGIHIARSLLFMVIGLVSVLTRAPLYYGVEESPPLDCFGDEEARSDVIVF
jgi:hypothetical protein